MNYAHKRYWEPSITQDILSSVSVGVLATALWQPLDMIKTRIQQRAEGIGIRQLGHYAGYNPNKVFREIHEQGHGMRGLYAGFDSALLGRGVYLFTRNLVYKIIYDRFKPVKPSNDLTANEKSLIAAISGAVAAIVSNPFEVVLIRQQVDGAFPPERRRNYKSFFDGYNRIVSQENGTIGLMKGVFPSILRSIALNISISAPFNIINECMWNCFGDTYVNRPIALVFGALSATFFALPFDNIKTRLQFASTDPAQNRINYEGAIDCGRKILLIESWQGFYVGFYAFFVRMYLYGITTILAMDYITTRWKKKAGLKPKYI